MSADVDKTSRADWFASEMQNEKGKKYQTRTAFFMKVVVSSMTCQNLTAHKRQQFPNF